MPDVNELKRWLKMGDLSEGDIVDIIDEGKIKDFEFEDKKTKEKKSGKALEITVSVNGGIHKGLTLNSLTIQSLCKEWGGHSSSWVGKKAIVDTATTMSFGKLTEINYLKPMVWEEESK